MCEHICRVSSWKWHYSYNFGKYCQIVSPRGCTSLYSHHRCVRGLVSWHMCQRHGFMKLLDFCQSDHVVLICIYLVIDGWTSYIFKRSCVSFFFPKTLNSFFYLKFFYLVVGLLKNWFMKTHYILERPVLCDLS